MYELLDAELVVLVVRVAPLARCLPQSVETGIPLIAEHLCKRGKGSASRCTNGEYGTPLFAEHFPVAGAVL